MPRIQNKVAIVTGGGAGLGEAIVRCFVSEGAKVIITDIQAIKGQQLAAELNCDFLQQDVTDEQQWQQIINQVEEKYGELHILVNNAGIEGPMNNTTPENSCLSDWQQIHRVNVEGVFLGCRTAIPALRKSGGGAIINMSSIAALGPTPNYTAYGASKAAVRHLTKSVALHCASDGSKIRCNSVHPGIILTAMLRRIIENTAKNKGISCTESRNEFKALIPQGEFQTPADIAHAVLFLVSDEAKHITGSKLVVDGGVTMGE